MILHHDTRATELLRQLIELERQHGHDASGIWDIVKELGKQLEALPTGAVFALIHNSRDISDDQGYWTCISNLRRRGDKETFDTCAAWVRDQSPDKRQAAADILAELGFPAGTPFSERSWPLLEPLLADGSVEVVASALAACGKLRIGVPATLATFVRNANRDLRFAAVGALSGRSDLISSGGLILLSRDCDRDIRNWATFGLGQLTEFDTREIRAALLARIEDDDPELGSEIRGEALIGLARRGDIRVLEPLKQELAGEFHGAWCIEAAHALKDPSLIPLLTTLRLRLEMTDARTFGDDIDQAIAACSSKLG
jgi:HEAT repeats